MKITKNNYLYELSFLPNVFPVNCFLVEEENELTLIDTALSFSAPKIIEAANRIGKKITNIVLTHAHGDHVGSLDQLKAMLPDAIVSISRRDSKILKGDTSLEANEPNTPIRGGIPKNIQTSPDRLLQEGDTIGSLVAVEAPGHTPGSMAFLDQRTNAIIAGDAFSLRGGFAISGQLRILFPFPSMATWNKEVAINSAKKISHLKPTLLAVGHGTMLPNPQEAIELAIKKQ
ncbi:MBL fold metallo-hydrolase [Gottfriedia luciferensis]|uniref:MBL fold metallo-hydrolase n=1 Tax=Gottfriedia luciferensis TaxID=178774 RepID=UPI000B44DB7D|nr:MBL fold metallo-hydrolase [Gottfriedia luciferensis]